MCKNNQIKEDPPRLQKPTDGDKKRWAMVLLSASKRADGIAIKGKTKGRFV
jgi:hypothetical protein